MIRGVAISGVLVLSLGSNLGDSHVSDAFSLLQTNARAADRWARGMNKCREMPNKTRSGCQVINKDSSQSTPRDCANWARKQKADGINFGANECEAISCLSTNMRVVPSTTDIEVYSDYCGLDLVRKNITGDCGTETTKYYKHPLPPAYRVCRYRPSFKQLVFNNLQAGGMRFKEVMGKTTDLLITAETPYKPSKASATGQNGNRNLGVLNVGSNTSVDLKFSFVETGTNNPTQVESFTFSVFDIDQGMKCLSRSYINVTNHDSYFITKDTELIVKNGPMDSPWTSFKSSVRGSRGDEPAGPQKLQSHKGHSQRAVTLYYNRISSFTVTFGIEGGVEGRGRNFLFGGLSNLLKQHCKDVKSLKEVRAHKQRLRDAKKAKRLAKEQAQEAKKQRLKAKKAAKRAARLAREQAQEAKKQRLKAKKAAKRAARLARR